MKARPYPARVLCERVGSFDFLKEKAGSSGFGPEAPAVNACYRLSSEDKVRIVLARLAQARIAVRMVDPRPDPNPKRRPHPHV